MTSGPTNERACCTARAWPMALATLLAMSLSAAGMADAAPARQAIAPSESRSAIEQRLAKALASKFKVETELTPIGGRKDDVQLVTRFRAEPAQNLPAVAIFIDTRVLTRDAKGLLAQAIRIYSAADLVLGQEQRGQALEWANRWNDNALPMRVQIAGDRVVLVYNLLTTRENPVSEGYVLDAYLQVAKIWPSVLNSLRDNGLAR